MTMLKKGFLLCLLSFVVLSAPAQQAGEGGTMAFDAENEQIISALDSLVQLTFFRSPVPDLQRSNAYGFAPHDIPSYPDSVIDARLKHLESPMPMEFNNHVRGFIDLYAVRRKAYTERILGLSTYYFPLFEAILEKHQLPHQLKYLAVVESALNPNAVSRAGATGLWQFMYPTGKMYGLKVNYYIDERRDPELATEAAAQYFKDLYGIYKDWFLVLAAYNCGPGNVNRAIRKSGGKTNYWDLMPYLPRETRGYVPAFVAVAYVMQYAEAHNLQPAALVDLPAHTDTVQVKGPVNLQYFSLLLDVPEEQLARINPQLKQQFIPQAIEAYTLHLPAAKIPEFERKRELMFAYLNPPAILSDSLALADSCLIPQIDSIRAVLAAAVEGPKVITIQHRVRSGETLSGISVQYGVSVAAIKQQNKLTSNMLRVGQRLTIEKQTDGKGGAQFAQSPPQKAPVQRVDNSSAVPASTARNTAYYTVKPGDSLWSISQGLPGVTVADLQKANNLNKNSKIKPGQKLKIQTG